MAIQKWRPWGVVPGDPFGRISSLRDEMDRIFAEFFDEMHPSLLEKGWAPAVDVVDKGKNYLVRCELPGMKKEDVRVSISNGKLSIEGERKQETEDTAENYYRMERSYGKFCRSIELPGKVKETGIKASFKDGVLEVVLPKVAEAVSREVKIAES